MVKLREIRRYDLWGITYQNYAQNLLQERVTAAEVITVIARGAL